MCTCCKGFPCVHVVQIPFKYDWSKPAEDGFRSAPTAFLSSPPSNWRSAKERSQCVCYLEGSQSQWNRSTCCTCATDRAQHLWACVCTCAGQVSCAWVTVLQWEPYGHSFATWLVANVTETLLRARGVGKGLDLFIHKWGSVWTTGLAWKLPGCAELRWSTYKAHNNQIVPQAVVVAEWLRRQTRNLLGSARAGSNPADYAFFVTIFNFSYLSVTLPLELTYTQLPSRSGSIQGAVTLERTISANKKLDISVGE